MLTFTTPCSVLRSPSEASTTTSNYEDFQARVRIISDWSKIGFVGFNFNFKVPEHNIEHLKAAEDPKC